MIILVTVMMMFVSTMVEASMNARVRTGYYYGAPVYWVKIVNDTSVDRYCTLTASNGAVYSGWVPAYGESGWMRINDRRATYRYRCR